MSKEELVALKAFFADRFMRLQDTGCRRIVTGKKFKGADAIGITKAFDPSMRGEAQITTVTCQELLEYIHHADPRVSRCLPLCSFVGARLCLSFYLCVFVSAPVYPSASMCLHAWECCTDCLILFLH